MVRPTSYVKMFAKVVQLTVVKKNGPKNTHANPDSERKSACVSVSPNPIEQRRAELENGTEFFPTKGHFYSMESYDIHIFRKTECVLKY